MSILPLNFSYENYIKLNKDLNYMNESQAIKHYLNIGKTESRIYKINLPPDFDYKTYIFLNTDLENLNEENAIDHYLRFGLFENRIYKYILPDDFIAAEYLKLNKDLGYISDNDAIRHYCKHGIFENRPYKNDNNNNSLFDSVPEDFDWKYYISNNLDIVVSQETPEEDAKRHYMLYGHKEFYRFYKEPIFSHFKENNLFDSSNLFNILIGFFSEKIINNDSYSKLKGITLLDNCYYHDDTSTLDCNKLIYHKENKFKNTILLSDFDNYDSFILIIDFPNLGGGTTNFLDAIIAKYKTSQNFLILRKYNGHCKFTINDNKIFKKEFSEAESFHFLLNINNKIIKIFINHFLSFSDSFLKVILLLKKEITTITHDYLWITDKADHYYHELIEHVENNISNKLKNIDRVVTQNVENLRVFKKCNNKCDFIISSLPDFNKSDQKIITNNVKNVIGIVGAISDIKGRGLIKLLLKIYENSHDIEFVFLGECNVNKTGNKNNVYKNILEFNELLMKLKPNLILETSLWPETYCYCLTLSMLTRLPIVSIKKPFPSVIENRLTNYDKYYSFTSINEAKNIFKTVKQDFFYTIDSMLFYNEFWDNYFSGDLTNETLPVYDSSGEENKDDKLLSKNINLVFISSKIYVSDLAYTYAQVRSIYTPAERFQQTVETIASIRKYIPNSYIVLFDNSKFESEQFNKLNETVDYFINLCEDDELNEYTNNKSSKIYGELAQFFSFLEYWEKNIKNLNFKQFFKISGRYLVNETFDYDAYDNNFNVFKKNNSNKDKLYFYTSFFKISCQKFGEFSKIMRELFKESKTHSNYDNLDFEVVIPQKLNYDFIEIDNLGITQNLSVWKQQDKI